MPTHQLGKAIRELVPTDEREIPDGQFLTRFVSSGDEAAFAALVRRHGPMVWGVCRRILGNSHDAEDAFQTTFLVLARKAPSVSPADTAAPWLHGVARRAALHARRTVARRRERPMRGVPRSIDPDFELEQLLDQELARLPAMHRAVVVLCELEGKTRAEAAKHLGLPEGTVASRLSRARATLARRLGRYGLAIAASVGLTGPAVAVPPALVSSTIHVACLPAVHAASASVASLTHGVLNAMLIAKLRVVVSVALLVVGGAVAAWGQPAGKSPAPAAGAKKGGDAKKGADDLAELQGNWTATALEGDGQKAPEDAVKAFKVTIKGNQITFNPQADNRTSTFRLDPSKNPKELTATPADGPQKGVPVRTIYSLKNGVLTLCMNNAGGEPPTEFATKAGDGLRLLVLKKEK
ncbi:MAG TPA: sigma-70 family RNA polymerase sigma factor [Urbifossiella sp.]|jgi:RNA polymerase sigma-70 factor (ECF subfamily)|nr:sigma-70 family RNA polymerase sigma factor [Urbifossiella sp.]